MRGIGLMRMARLDRILRRMIATAYPELRRLPIAVGFRALDGDTLFRYDWDQGRYSILAGEEFRDAPAAVVEGGVAHELAHLVRDSARPPRLLDRALDHYGRSRAYRIRDERATDALAVQRGFGPQLIALIRYARSRGIRFHAEHGLHSREIAARCRPPAAGA